MISFAPLSTSLRRHPLACLVLALGMGLSAPAWANYGSARFGALKVQGNKIVNAATGCPVFLKGVDIPSMEWQNTGEGPSGTTNGVLSTAQNAVNNWGVNIIRVPLNQDRWLGSSACSGLSQANYWALVDAIVNWCSANNCYVLLDLHWSDQGGSGAQCASGQHSMPDNGSVAFWTSLAAHYANNSAVLFDLFNEPEGFSSWSLWRNGGTTPEGYSTPGMQKLVNTIRDTGAKNVITAGGLNWAFDLTGVPSNALTDANTAGTLSGNGIVYVTHIYPWKQSPDCTRANGCFDAAIPSAVTGSYAVMVTEFGQDKNNSSQNAAVVAGTWSQDVIDWAIANTSGYVAWSNSIDACPCLITNWNYTSLSTDFGATVVPDLQSANPVLAACGASTVTSSPTTTPSVTPLPPTATLTRTTTPSATPLPPTATATRTTTPSVTPLPPTATLTDTATPSATPLPPTDTLTRTSTPSATPVPPASTATDTSTPSATPLPSTGTDTSTPTGTPGLATATLTDTPVPPTGTGTPMPPLATATPTSSATPTPSLTTTASPTATLLPPTATATVTSTPTPMAPASTPTPTVTMGPATVTASPSATAVTPTSTATPTPGPAAPMLNSVNPGQASGGDRLLLQGSGFAAGATVSVDGSPMTQLTVTGSTIQGTLPAHAAGLVRVVVTNPDGLASQAQSFIYILKLTPTGGGPLKILGIQPVPQPNPLGVAIDLSGPVDRLTLRLWTKAMILVASFDSQNGRAGWQTLVLPSTFLGDLANGTYYLTVAAQSGAAQLVAPQPLRLVLIR